MTQDDDELERKFAPRTLPEQVAEELGAEIVAGRRKPGERLTNSNWRSVSASAAARSGKPFAFWSAAAWSISTRGAAPMCGRCR